MKIVTLDENMIRGVCIIGDDGAFLDFRQDRQFAGQLSFHILRLVLPDDSIFLPLMKQIQQGRFLIVRQAVQRLYLLGKRSFVHDLIPFLFKYFGHCVRQVVCQIRSCHVTIFAQKRASLFRDLLWPATAIQTHEKRRPKRSAPARVRLCYFPKVLVLECHKALIPTAWPSAMSEEKRRCF